MNQLKTSNIFDIMPNNPTPRSGNDESMGRNLLLILIIGLAVLGAFIGSAYAVFGWVGALWAVIAITAKIIWDKRVVWALAAIGALLCFGFFPFLLVVCLALLLC